MIINCPICGSREANEYTYLGDATVKRPDPQNTNMRDWSAYVFQRNNPRGAHEEHWQHTSGCRSVLKVIRNTVSHEVLKVELEGPWASEVNK